MLRRALVVLMLALATGCAHQTAALKASPPADLSAAVEWRQTPFFPQTEHQCGPAALATALGALGIGASPAALADEAFLPARSGSLQTEMLGAARRHGAVATRIPGRLESLLREVAAGHVVVVLLNLGLGFAPRWHYAVVVGYDLAASELVMRSGTTERDRISMRTFEYTWARSDHWAFVASPPGAWPVTAMEREAVEAAIGFERVAAPAQRLKVYESGLMRWPESLPLAIGLGNAAYAVGDKPRAIAVFRRAAEHHGSGAAWLNVSKLLLEEGQRAAAVEAAERAARDPLWAQQARDWLAQPTMRP